MFDLQITHSTLFEMGMEVEEDRGACEKAESTKVTSIGGNLVIRPDFPRGFRQAVFAEADLSGTDPSMFCPPDGQRVPERFRLFAGLARELVGDDPGRIKAWH